MYNKEINSIFNHVVHSYVDKNSDLQNIEIVLPEHASAVFNCYDSILIEGNDLGDVQVFPSTSVLKMNHRKLLVGQVGISNLSKKDYVTMNLKLSTILPEEICKDVPQVANRHLVFETYN